MLRSRHRSARRRRSPRRRRHPRIRCPHPTSPAWASRQRLTIAGGLAGWQSGPGWPAAWLSKLTLPWQLGWGRAAAGDALGDSVHGGLHGRWRPADACADQQPPGSAAGTSRQPGREPSTHLQPLAGGGAGGPLGRGACLLRALLLLVVTALRLGVLCTQPTADQESGSGPWSSSRWLHGQGVVCEPKAHAANCRRWPACLPACRTCRALVAVLCSLPPGLAAAGWLLGAAGWLLAAAGWLLGGPLWRCLRSMPQLSHLTWLVANQPLLCLAGPAGPAAAAVGGGLRLHAVNAERLLQPRHACPSSHHLTFARGVGCSGSSSLLIINTSSSAAHRHAAR